MKHAVDLATYLAAIERAGGVTALVPISTYTYCDGSPFHGPGRHIFTAWGKRDGTFVAEHEEHNGEHTYRIDDGRVRRDG